MSILAIIVSYNFVPWMGKCLGSLRHSDYPVDILVVDNHSQDDTLAVLRNDYPEVTVIANNDNLGFGRANNIGMIYAMEHHYDAVLLLNEDAWLQPGTLKKLVKVAARCPQFGILSPVHLTGAGDKLESGFAHYIGVSDIKALPEDTIVEVNFIDAAIWFLPMAAIKSVGMFSPIFKHYGEDKDLANRLRYYGWKTGYLPHAWGHHARENRVVTRESRMYSVWVYLLSEYTNINYSLPMSFAKSVLAAVKKALLASLHAKFRDSVTYLGMAFTLMGRTREVLATRRESLHVNLKNYE